MHIFIQYMGDTTLPQIQVSDSALFLQKHFRGYQLRKRMDLKVSLAEYTTTSHGVAVAVMQG